MAKDQLEVDIDELCEAYEFSNFENSYYLDLDTGEVLLIVHHSGVAEQNRKNKKKIEQDDEGRYIKVPSTDSREGYRDMQDFIQTVDDKDLREKLRIAIDGKGAFRRFKDVLKRYPEERERWFEFKDERTRKRVLEWLERQEIGSDFTILSSSR
ncbi:MAG: hypothetical protein KGY66_08470 [Candidatus Thermoplasmatota archaeon]|nr:hypothetical protein [Candidatus Thermoplasmatota archaeon]MBS3790930.1 hypothetical protein [Candidatus Thermoplasmatota archaeon]